MGMRDEILEIPRILRKLEVPEEATKLVENSREIHVVANGSSYNVSLVASYLNPKVRSHMAFEFLLSKGRGILAGDTLMAVSQSGETWDVVEAVRLVQAKAVPILSITNYPGSSLGKYSTMVVPLNAGQEGAIPATKTVTSTLAVLLLLTNELSLKNVSKTVKTAINKESEWKEISQEISNSKNIFLLSAGILYPVAIEGALKLKESAYLHAEAIEFEEYFHGSRAVPEDEDSILAIEPIEDYGKAMFWKKVEEIKDDCDKVFIIKSQDSVLDIFRVLTAFQFLAYWSGVFRGIPVDAPRRLVKVIGYGCS